MFNVLLFICFFLAKTHQEYMEISPYRCHDKETLQEEALSPY